MKIKIKYEGSDLVKRSTAKLKINDNDYDLQEAKRIGHLILEKVREAEWETTYGPFGVYQLYKYKHENR